MHKNIIQYKYKKFYFLVLHISSEYLPPVVTSRKNVASPKLAPSNVYVEDSDMDLDFDSDECDQIEEKTKCCGCVKSNLMQ
jgi:hypothetical protein